MMGLVSAGCSSAPNSRPNAALVAESKRSGSSSSGGAVASGISSAGAGVRCFEVAGAAAIGHQRWYSSWLRLKGWWVPVLGPQWGALEDANLLRKRDLAAAPRNWGGGEDA